MGESGPAADVALVTGAGSGFGELIAKTLAGAGCRVWAGMRDPRSRNRESAERLSDWARAEEAALEVVELDVTSDASVGAAVATVEAAAGRIDVVVNNAGVASVGPLEAFAVEQVAAILDTNALGPLRVDKAVLPGMRARGSGLLIHVSSALGRVLPGIGGPYAASKWALEGVAEGLGNQVAAFGVDVVLLEPGSYPTDALARGVVPADPAVAEAYALRSGAPRRPDYGDPPPDPQEVADATLAIVRAPAGERPRRVVVGSILTAGVAEYNAHYERLARELRADPGLRR